jgi:hypothetical protein
VNPILQFYPKVLHFKVNVALSRFEANLITTFISFIRLRHSFGTTTCKTTCSYNNPRTHVYQVSSKHDTAKPWNAELTKTRFVQTAVKRIASLDTHNFHKPNSSIYKYNVRHSRFPTPSRTSPPSAPLPLNFRPKVSRLKPMEIRNISIYPKPCDILRSTEYGCFNADRMCVQRTPSRTSPRSPPLPLNFRPKLSQLKPME